MIGPSDPVPALTTSSQSPVFRVTLATLVLGGCDGDRPATELPALPPRVEAVGLGPSGVERPFRELTVALTGEVRGEIEPCGCPTVPYGGFPRRLAALDGLRAEGVPTFVLDAGEMLVKGDNAAAAPDRRARAEVVLDLARRVGVDAWAAAPTDLLPGGLALLRPSTALSANWVGEGDAPVLPPARIVERDGVRLGVIGLGAPPREEGLRAREPVAAVRAAMVGAADLWVVVSNAPQEINRAVADGVPGLGAVLSTRGAALDPPLLAHGAPILETADRGRFLTVLRVFTATEPGPLALVEEAPWRRYAEERRRVSGLAPGPARAAAEAGLAALREEVVRATAGRAVAWVEDRPLGSDLDQPGALDPAIAAFKGEAVQRAQARVAEAPPTQAYATAGSCAGCHTRRFTQWLGDPHRVAYDSLLARGKGDDVECIGCHTTGFGEPGGFAELTPAALATWKSVQCEACHGPLSGHPRDARVEARAVTQETCVRCHDRANSPAFDYGRYLERISCVRVSAEGAGPGVEP